MRVSISPFVRQKQNPAKLFDNTAGFFATAAPEKNLCHYMLADRKLDLHAAIVFVEHLIPNCDNTAR